MLLVHHIQSEYSRVCHENGCFIGLNYVVCASVLEVFHRRDTHVCLSSFLFYAEAVVSGPFPGLDGESWLVLS